MNSSHKYVYLFGIRTPQQVSLVGSRRWVELALVSEQERARQYPSLEELMPQILGFETLLEDHFRDMQDIEFTIQEGKLWMLQTRNGKRTGAAMVRIAMEMLKQGMVDGITALLRSSPDRLNELLHSIFDPKALKAAKLVARVACPPLRVRPPGLPTGSVTGQGPGARFRCQNSRIRNLYERSRLKSAALTLSLTTALVLTLGACSKQDTPAAPATPTTSAITTSSYDKVAATGKGFSVGALMSAQAVYVLFDPQCPHCGHLWQASLPLHDKVKFVWVPIAFNSGKSLAQAAALLSAANPLEAMSAHEQSLLAGTGGMAASSSPPDELVQAVKNNTQLLNSLGVDSVPFILAKNRHTGDIVSNNGAMDTGALAKLLGVD